MSGEVEAAGAAITAGLAAAAIDGTKPHGEDGHGACANCGAVLDGNYCAICGQPAHIHRTLGHMAEEFLHGLLHFDTRAWKTLPLLVFRPGTLTHNYIHGKRARYISPLAIFLLAIFSMFAVFAVSGGSRIGVDDPDRRIERMTPAVVEATARLTEASMKVTALAAGGASDTEVAAAEAEVDAASRKLDEVTASLEAFRSQKAQLEGAEAPAAGEDLNVTIEFETGSVYEAISEAVKSGKLKIDTGWPWFDKKLTHKLENPELAVYKIQNAAYKFAFLLVPISLPFIWLMFFWKRGVTLFDHTVYILYSLSFVSLLFIAASLLSYWPAALSVVGPVLLLAGPVHAFFHLKGGYGLGWFSALWRMPVLIAFAGIGLFLFLLAIVAVGFVG